MLNPVKRLLCFCLFVLIIHSCGEGQALFKINQYNIVSGGDLMPVITLFGNYPLNKYISITSYFYVNAYPKGSWGEGLAGLTVTPVKGISLGFLGGFQSNETELWRVSPIIMLSKKQFSFFGAFEFGGTRYRWDAMGFYSLKTFKFGAEFIRYYQMYAAGPRIEFSFLKKQPITVFYSGLWDWTRGRYDSMFGIYSTFGFSPGTGIPDD
ncbi:MAG: hypothetical protein M0P58_04585 [Bacteroidales bacterium]|jgi:hypothetical protein|nr:hypothetical protein [Bacteroidales bacterium]